MFMSNTRCHYIHRTIFILHFTFKKNKKVILFYPQFRTCFFCYKRKDILKARTLIGGPIKIIINCILVSKSLLFISNASLPVIINHLDIICFDEMCLYHIFEWFFGHESVSKDVNLLWWDMKNREKTHMYFVILLYYPFDARLKWLNKILYIEKKKVGFLFYILSRMRQQQRKKKRMQILVWLGK